MEEVRATSTPQSFKCHICNDEGFIINTVNGTDYAKDCVCEIKKMNLQRLYKSGLQHVADKCTFDKFETTEEFQKFLKQRALEFLEQQELTTFFVGGQVGSGKTHICTSICLEFISRGKNVKYYTYSDLILDIKSKAKDVDEQRNSYSDINNKSITVLYIDDLFKTANISEADKLIIYKIIDFRYTNNLTTIISSEKSLTEITEIDEAIGSRIAEKAKMFELVIGKDKNKNYRLK